jgi:hypothetical protein
MQHDARSRFLRHAILLRSSISRRLTYTDQFVRPGAGCPRRSRVSVLVYGSVVRPTGSLAIALYLHPELPPSSIVAESIVDAGAPCGVRLGRGGANRTALDPDNKDSSEARRRPQVSWMHFHLNDRERG